MSSARAPAMTARSLHRYAMLDDRRRRKARRGPAAWPRAAWAGLLGLLHGGWVLGAGEAAPESAAARTLVLTAALFLIALCGAPFRLFWRRDSALLARLPLTGRALYGLALFRSLAAAGLCLIALTPSVAALALADPALAGRAAAVALAFAALAGLAGPAIALAAGAIVASETAHAAIASLSGEFSAPRTVWLGSLPALAGTLLLVLAIDLSGWLTGGAPLVGDGPILLVGVALGSALAAGWAWLAADRAMPGALREVAALDRERLAHVDRSTPSWLERAVSGRLRRAGRLVFDKDARLLRRRYPSPYALGPLGVLLAWGLSFGGAAGLSWGVALTTGLAAYAALMARRTVVAPVELARLSPTLPIAPAAADGARRAEALLRTATWVLLAGGPLVVRHPTPPMIAWLATIAVGSALAAGRAPRPRGG